MPPTFSFETFDPPMIPMLYLKHLIWFSSIDGIPVDESIDLINVAFQQSPPKNNETPSDDKNHKLR